MTEIAAMLNVSPRTVAFHKYQMMKHLRIRTTAEFIQFAMQPQIVRYPDANNVK